MPTTRVEIDVQGTAVEIQADFQLWCSECGHGMCSDTNYKRGTDNHFTTHCENCADKLNDVEKELSKANSEIEDLKSEIEELKRELEKQSSIA